MSTSDSTQNQALVFGEIDRLVEHLTRQLHRPPTIGATNPPKDPIVLVPGFMGWSSPLLGAYNYFGGLINIAEILASQGWPVICPHIGPVSSNYERACELYASLAHGSMDGTTYDIVVDYGIAIPGSGLVYTDPRPLRKQATCFNMDPSWRWGEGRPVHFVAHSQGGNTVRFLIHLLDKGSCVEKSGYFCGGPKRGWVRSLVTLATPHNGSSIINVLEDLGKADDLLVDRMICAASYQHPVSRIFDFCLDHRGIGPPTAPTVDLQDYVTTMCGENGALTRWRRSSYNGFLDNSIVGVVGGVNQAIREPSKDVYYFTLSFAATIGLPGIEMEARDLWGEGVSDNLEAFLAGVPGLGAVLGGWVGKLGLNALSFVVTLLRETFGRTLQDVAIWAVTRINARLPPGIPKVPTPGSTVPRFDMFPGFLIVSYGMGAYKLTPKERELVKAAGGPTDDKEWREHDGVVPTCSMAGPWGKGNVVVRVNDVLGGRPGVWVDLGKCDWMDHADCIGSCFNPATVSEVVRLYLRIGKLLDALPAQPRQPAGVPLQWEAPRGGSGGGMGIGYRWY
ncbi:Alpha/Beta hydrolase protein [Kalaharituber pfeilii]|nr:Alpha/Beta hydrolase protein [Kalaharituber pfeilii]